MLCYVSENETGTMKSEYELLGVALRHTKLSAEGDQSRDFDASVYINLLFLMRRTK